jgi:hypothetical protein
VGAGTVPYGIPGVRLRGAFFDQSAGGAYRVGAFVLLGVALIVCGIIGAGSIGLALGNGRNAVHEDDCGEAEPDKRTSR